MSNAPICQVQLLHTFCSSRTTVLLLVSLQQVVGLEAILAATSFWSPKVVLRLLKAETESDDAHYWKYQHFATGLTFTYASTSKWGVYQVFHMLPNHISSYHLCKYVTGKQLQAGKACTLTIVATIVLQLLLFEVNNICADIVKETLVMWNYQKCLLPILQVAA